jgi:PKHD-type hydroxylase
MNEILPSWSLYQDHKQYWSHIDRFFTKQECEAIIEYGKKQNLVDAVLGAGYLNNEVRKSKIAFIGPTAEIRHVFEKLTDAVFLLNDRLWDFDLYAFGEHLQFTEYAEGEKYESHTDTILGGPIRKLSIILQLTDENEYEGGNIEAFSSIENPMLLPRAQGTVLAFPSYLVHRVTPITKGTRHSLVGWVNGKPFR